VAKKKKLKAARERLERLDVHIARIGLDRFQEVQYCISELQKTFLELLDPEVA